MIFSRRQIAKKDNSVSRLLQRAALFFCSFVLVFTIVQPAEVIALGAFQPKPGDIPVTPLTTAKPAADSHIAKSLPDDQTAKLDAPLKVDS